MNVLPPVSRYVVRNLPVFTALGATGAAAAPYLLVQSDLEKARLQGVGNVEIAEYAFQATTSLLAIYAVVEGVRSLDRKWSGQSAEPLEAPEPSSVRSRMATRVAIVGTLAVLTQLGFGLKDAVQAGRELAESPDAKTGFQFAASLIFQPIQSFAAKAGALTLANTIKQGKTRQKPENIDEIIDRYATSGSQTTFGCSGSSPMIDLSLKREGADLTDSRLAIESGDTGLRTGPIMDVGRELERIQNDHAAPAMAG